MPLYEYCCETCGDRFEVLQRLGEGSAGVTCPKCGGDDVARQLSTFAAASSSGGGGISASPSCGGGGGGCGGGGFT